MQEHRNAFKLAIDADDHAALAALLDEHAGLLPLLNAPLFKWGMPPLAAAKSVATAELLRRYGAEVEKVGEWWGPGFGVRLVVPEVGRRLAAQGARLTPHAAAALGLVDELTHLLDADSALVRAKGGDEATPLHFARDLPTARLLVERGADVDARDADHASTPAQWLIGEAPEVSRYLLERGATPDIFLAAALNDRVLAARLIAADPDCVGHRIGKESFHSIGHEGLGGTILQWTLGFNSYAHQIAKKKGNDALFEFLWERSDVPTRFLAACVTAMRPEAEAIAARNPALVDSQPDED